MIITCFFFQYSARSTRLVNEPTSNRARPLLGAHLAFCGVISGMAGADTSLEFLQFRAELAAARHTAENAQIKALEAEPEAARSSRDITGLAVETQS